MGCISCGPVIYAVYNLKYCIISSMWNIRMRASKKAGKRLKENPGASDSRIEIHISGAEGICEESEIPGKMSEYALRALRHMKGKPESIIISAKEIKQQIRQIRSLAVTTLACRSPRDARNLIRKFLLACGISDAAIETAFDVTKGARTMRGAALVLSRSGKRMEPDMERGIRASRLGISKSAEKVLSQRLAKEGLDNPAVKEALILASKVASCEDIIAEFCISDDPEYTTGYVSSRRFGYLRIPHIKNRRGKEGGRVFFLREDADVDFVAGYLEKTPVMITRLSPIHGIRRADEFIDNID
jgi:6-carboxyhexanoate--CoA ligase